MNHLPEMPQLISISDL